MVKSYWVKGEEYEKEIPILRSSVTKYLTVITATGESDVKYTSNKTVYRKITFGLLYQKINGY